MVQLKLVGAGYYFDNFGNEGFSYTRKSIDFQKPDNTYNDFSQKVNLPATQRNNKLFQFYYNTSVQNGFNPFIKNECELWFNSELYSTGALLFIDAKYKDGKIFMYTVQFYSDTINLKEALQDKGLNDLKWQDLDHSMTAANVRNYMLGTSPDGGGLLYYPMASMDNAWVWELAPNASSIEGIREIKSGKDGILNTEVRPAVLVDEVVKRIFDTAGFDYVVDFDTNDYWDKLYMWVNNGKVVTSEAQIVQAGIGASTQVLIAPTASKLVYSRSIVDESQLYSTITGETTITFATNYTLTTHFRYPFVDGVPQFRYVKNGVPAAWQNMPNQTEVVTNLGALVAGDVIHIEIRLDGGSLDRPMNNDTWFRIEGSTASSFDFFEVAKFMPSMKCIDFLKGLLVAFNAVMVYDNINSRFVIQHRDVWFSNGNEIDLSMFIDSESQVIKPPTFYKTYGFEFEKGKDLFNVDYMERNGRDYGSAFYDTGMYFGTTYSSKCLFTSNIWQEVVTQDNQGGISVESNIAAFYSVDKSFKNVDSGVRLMYYNGTAQATNGQYMVVDFDGNSAGAGTNHNRFLNFCVSDEVNLSFQPERDFKQSGFGINEPNLYSEFYSDYISAIYNPNVRRIYLEALMPYAKLKTIQLNDTIIWNDKPYLIDQMTINMVSGKVKFNLINKL